MAGSTKYITLTEDNFNREVLETHEPEQSAPTRIGRDGQGPSDRNFVGESF